ncbi:MAG: hypothetical protein V3V71_09105 [Roseateles sp.]
MPKNTPFADTEATVEKFIEWLYSTNDDERRDAQVRDRLAALVLTVKEQCAAECLAEGERYEAADSEAKEEYVATCLECHGAILQLLPPP